MKLLSWNVNGIRAVLKKGFLEMLKKEQPDILGLQEIKIDKAAIKKEEFDFPGYTEFWNPAQRKGYSGTAILVRADHDFSALSTLSWDIEGRISAIDAENYYFVNVYFPNANHELSRLGFKIGFNDRLLKYIKKLEKDKPVVVCGDYNVAHEEIDLARPRENVGNPGFTDEERQWMTKFIKAGYIDTFRHFHPKRQLFSWWSYRAHARDNDIGWRIDYVCVSRRFEKKIEKAFILNEIHGSDHCPVGIEIG